jgi:uncharacterized membrane protein YccC
MRLSTLVAEDGWLRVRFAVNTFISSIIVWIGIAEFSHADPIWAIASMVASCEPVVKQALKMFRSRLINTAVGCAIGLLFVSIGQTTPWKLPFALAISVLISSYIVRIPVMWRQAPITAVIVIAGSLTEHSKIVGVEVGLRRVSEVIFGCVIALGVSWLMATVWPLRESTPKPEKEPDKAVSGTQGGSGLADATGAHNHGHEP